MTRSWWVLLALCAFVSLSSFTSMASDGRWGWLAVCLAGSALVALWVRRALRRKEPVVVSRRVAELGVEAIREMKHLGMHEGSVHELIERHRASAALFATDRVFKDLAEGRDGQT